MTEATYKEQEFILASVPDGKNPLWQETKQQSAGVVTGGGSWALNSQLRAGSRESKLEVCWGF